MLVLLTLTPGFLFRPVSLSVLTDPSPSTSVLLPPPTSCCTPPMLSPGKTAFAAP